MIVRESGRIWFQKAPPEKVQAPLGLNWRSRSRNHSRFSSRGRSYYKRAYSIMRSCEGDSTTALTQWCTQKNTIIGGRSRKRSRNRTLIWLSRKSWVGRLFVVNRGTQVHLFLHLGRHYMSQLRNQGCWVV